MGTNGKRLQRISPVECSVRLKTMYSQHWGRGLEEWINLLGWNSTQRQLEQ